MSYQIIPLSAGEVSHCKLSELSRHLRPNTLLAVLNRKGVVTHSYPITAHTFVCLAVEIADYALCEEGREVHQESQRAIIKARAWCADPEWTDTDELIDAADAAEETADVAMQCAEDEQEELDRECDNGGGDFTALGYDENDYNAAYAAAAAARAAACLSEGNTQQMDRDVFRAISCAAGGRNGTSPDERGEYARQGRYICAYLKRTYAGGVTA